MYKLIGHSLSRGEKIVPETQPMTLQERDSTSTITLDPESAPGIGFDDWILDDGWPEGNYVWRVRSISEATPEDNVTVELEHVIKTLDDIKIAGEITTKMISGGSSCTAREAVEYLLARQSCWTLGDFDYNVSNPYEFTGGSLLDAIETVSGTLEDSQWEYDLSVFPFVLHIRHRSTEAACEIRGGRNLSTLRKNISRAGMFTRIYPIGKNNLRIDGEYLSKNENLYGRIDKVETDQNKSTKENLRAWAQGLLNRHCEPEMNVSISGLEMSAETGEALDRLRMNKVCRVPLPKRGTIILERIVRMQWKDRRKEPENVSVTLANNSADIAQIVKNTRRASGRAAQGQAKQNYLFQANGDNLLYEVFDECGHVHGILRMTEESLRIAFDNTIESARSEFRMTAESLRIQFENEIESTRSQFEMTSESLRIQFENEIESTRSEFQMTSESLRVQFENEIESTRSEFQMTAESLRVTFENEIESTRSEFQMTSESLRIQFENETSSLRGAISAEAGRISLVVEGTGSNAHIKPASIVAAINADNTSETIISAGKVKIDGNTTINDVFTVNSGDVYTKVSLYAMPGAVFNGDHVGSFYYSEQQQGHSVAYGILKRAAVDGNTLKIWKFGDSESSPSVTFSKATSVSGDWGGTTTYSVEATQTNGGQTTTVGTTSTTVFQAIEGSPNPNATVYAKMYHTDPTVAGNQIGSAVEMTLGENVSGKYVELYTGSGVSKIQKGKVSTQDTYNAGDAAGQLTGWSEAYGKMSWPGNNTSSASMTVKGPAATKATNPNQVSVEYTLSSGDDVAYIKQGAVVVAQLTHNKYSSGNAAGQLTGWSEAYGKMSWPGNNTSSASMTVKGPAATKASSPNQQSVEYTLSTDNNVAYIKQGATVVAQLTHNKYSSGDAAGQLTGWSEAYGKVSWPGSNTSTASMTMKAPAATKATNPNQVSREYTVSVDSSYAYIKQGATTVARVSHTQYSDGNAAGQLTGWSEAYGKVSWPGSNTSTASMTVKAPAATKASSPNQQSVEYTLSSGDNVAYIKQGSTVVAQLTHNKYSSGNAAGQLTGWSEAYGKVSWPGSNTSSASMTVKAPAATKATNPNQQSVQYTVSVDSSYGYIKQGATTVARVSHSYKYTQAQYDAALATVPSGYFNSATVTFSATDIGSSAEGNDNAITATAKNGSTTLGSATQVIHMGTGSWSSGKIGVTARMTNSSGAVIDRVYVNAPNATLGANTTTKPSGSALKTVTVGSGGNHTYFTVTVGGSYKGYVDIRY